MDEYLFMTLARLKADRLQLQREQRRAAPDPEPLDRKRAEPVDRRRRSAHGFSQQPLWREQS